MDPKLNTGALYEDSPSNCRDNLHSCSIGHSRVHRFIYGARAWGVEVVNGQLVAPQWVTLDYRESDFRTVVGVHCTAKREYFWCPFALNSCLSGLSLQALRSTNIILR